jgi:hypothetical protein
VGADGGTGTTGAKYVDEEASVLEAPSRRPTPPTSVRRG